MVLKDGGLIDQAINFAMDKGLASKTALRMAASSNQERRVPWRAYQLAGAWNWGFEDQVQDAAVDWIGLAIRERLVPGTLRTSLRLHVPHSAWGASHLQRFIWSACQRFKKEVGTFGIGPIRGEGGC